MNERNDESSLWQRRLKKKGMAKTTVLPYSVNNDDNIDKNPRYKKPKSFRKVATYCLYVQLVIAVLLLVVPPEWYKFAFLKAQSSTETPAASLSTPPAEESSPLTSSLSTPSPEEEEVARRAQALASMSKQIDDRCKNDANWKNDSFWKNSVEDPSVCFIGVPKPDDSLNLDVSHLMDSLGMWTWCGSYCVFHLESSPAHAVAGSTAGQKLKGWSLGELESGNASKGCFRPIEDITSSHCNEWYDKWAIWVNSSVTAQF
ncbi:hypothetical protein MHU86_14574 [Fragilaria crotonensis]|nr:hypothetical protein MHU86_14574 [Fragilaria crotonensis]